MYENVCANTSLATEKKQMLLSKPVLTTIKTYASYCKVRYRIKTMYMVTVFIGGITDGNCSVSFSGSPKVLNISVFQKYWSSELL